MYGDIEAVLCPLYDSISNRESGVLLYVGCSSWSIAISPSDCNDMGYIRHRLLMSDLSH